MQPVYQGSARLRGHQLFSNRPAHWRPGTGALGGPAWPSCLPARCFRPTRPVSALSTLPAPRARGVVGLASGPVPVPQSTVAFRPVALAGAFLFQALALHDGLVSGPGAAAPGHRARVRARAAPILDPSVHPLDHLVWRCFDLRWPGRVHRRLGTRRRPSHPDEPALHRGRSDLRRTGDAPVLAAPRNGGSPGRARPCTPRRLRSSGRSRRTLIKAATDTLTQFGVAGMFTRWPVYALAVGRAAGTFLQQVALHVGLLRVSQPFLVIVDPSSRIALSVWLFDERFEAWRRGPGRGGGRLRRDVCRSRLSDPSRSGDDETGHRSMRSSHWPPSSCGATMACPLPWGIPRPRWPPPWGSSVGWSEPGRAGRANPQRATTVPRPTCAVQ